MTPFLYIEDAVELAGKGETDLADAKVQVTGYAEAAQAKQGTLAEAQAVTAAMTEARAGLRMQLDDTRADMDRFGREKSEAALTNYLTTDHAANAEAHGRLARTSAWLTVALTTCDSVTMPAQIMLQRRAEAGLLRAMGSLFAARAILASAERFAAAKDLLKTDGVVTFGASGRAHDLLKSSLEFHRRASESDRAIHEEERRLSLINAAEGKV